MVQMYLMKLKNTVLLVQKNNRYKNHSQKQGQFSLLAVKNVLPVSYH